MKILYVVHTFPPEPGATQRSYWQAVGLQRLGNRVTVLTTMPNYPFGRVYQGYRRKILTKEVIDGVEIVRVWSIPAPNRGVLLRMVSTLSFLIVAVIAGFLMARRDLVIARVPSVGTEFAGLTIARAKGSRLLLEMEDLIPDNLVLYGISTECSAYCALSAYYKRVYRTADFIAAINARTVNLLKSRGVSPHRLLLWPNAADEQSLDDQTSRLEIRQKLSLSDKFVVVYAGSFSCYYDIPNIISTASVLQRLLPQVHFLILGTGADRLRVEVAIQQADLENVTLTGAVPISEVLAHMQAADLFIHSLVGVNGWIPRLYRDHLSAKACEYLMVGRPIIAVENGPVLGGILRRIGAGSCVPASDPEKLAEAVAFYATHPDETLACGMRAREYAQKHLGRNRVIGEFFAALDEKLNLKQRPNGNSS